MAKWRKFGKTAKDRKVSEIWENFLKKRPTKFFEEIDSKVTFSRHFSMSNRFYKTFQQDIFEINIHMNNGAIYLDFHYGMIYVPHQIWNERERDTKF